MSQDYLALAGISLIIGGLILAALSVILMWRRGGTRGSGGAIILLGPIPIVIGSNLRITLLMLILALALLILFTVGFTQLHV